MNKKVLALAASKTAIPNTIAWKWGKLKAKLSDHANDIDLYSYGCEIQNEDTLFQFPSPLFGLGADFLTFSDETRTINRMLAEWMVQFDIVKLTIMERLKKIPQFAAMMAHSVSPDTLIPAMCQNIENLEFAILFVLPLKPVSTETKTKLAMHLTPYFIVDDAVDEPSSPLFGKPEFVIPLKALLDELIVTPKIQPHVANRFQAALFSDDRQKRQVIGFVSILLALFAEGQKAFQMPISGSGYAAAANKYLQSIITDARRAKDHQRQDHAVPPKNVDAIFALTTAMEDREYSGATDIYLEALLAVLGVDVPHHLRELNSFSKLKKAFSDFACTLNDVASLTKSSSESTNIVIALVRIQGGTFNTLGDLTPTHMNLIVNFTNGLLKNLITTGLAFIEDVEDLYIDFQETAIAIVETVIRANWALTEFANQSARYKGFRLTR